MSLNQKQWNYEPFHFFPIVTSITDLKKKKKNIGDSNKNAKSKEKQLLKNSLLNNLASEHEGT